MHQEHHGSYPLIPSKIRSPQFVTALLERPRLTSWLNEHQDCRALVVAADAGYGKTTLLWQWEQTVDFPCYWYRLDGTDRDWSVEVSYLVASIRTRHPGFGESVASLFDSSGPGPNRPTATAYLLGEMHDTLRAPCTFIIDDWNLVGTSGEVRSFWNQVLRDAPRTCRFIFLSTGRPQLQFARFAAHQGFAELPRTALRFDRDEIAALFQHVYGTTLDLADVGLLEEVTEGWGVALQLIQASLLNRPIPADRRFFLDTVEASGGTSLFSFLAEEVMEQLPPEHRNFLISTSVVEHVTPELGERLGGRTNADRLLRDLEGRGLFTYRVDREGTTFRYHGLFREFLDRKLRSERAAEEVSGLHIHAASYFETTAMWPEAISHYFRANLQRQAGRLLAQHGESVASEGKLAIVDGWLGQLPRRLVREDARLGLLEGEVLGFVHGRWREGEDSILRALDFFHRKTDSRNEALACLKLSSLLLYSGQAEASAAAARRGIAVAKVADPIIRFRLDGNLAITAMWMESLPEVEAACEGLMTSADEMGSPHFAAIGQHNLGIVQVTMGKLDQGLANLRSAYEYWAALPGSPYADAADYVRALLLTGDVATASVIASDAVARTKPWPRPHAEATLGVAACRVHLGQYEDGLHLLRRLRARGAALGALDEHTTLLEIDAIYLAGSRVGMEAALQSLNDGPRDPRLEAESAVARALAHHSIGGCTTSCRGALKALDRSGDRGACLVVARDQVRLAPLLYEHRDPQAMATLKDGLIGCVQLGIAEHLSPWIRRCAPLVSQLDHGDQDQFVPALLEADPTFWRALAVELLPGFKRTTQKAILEAIAVDATPATLELLAEAQSGEAPAVIAQVQSRLTPRLYISTFGQLSVHAGSPDGSVVDLSKRRARHLLGVLAANEGRTVRRELIMDWLWPESDPASASNSLNQTVFQLRKVIHRAAAVPWSPPYLIAEGEAIGLNGALISTDLGEFRDLARTYAADAGMRRVDHARRMIAIVHDFYLADLQYEDWTLSFQGPIHAEVRETLLKIADPAGSTPSDLAYRAATAVLHFDPFDEQASAFAALQLSAGGRTRAAVELLTNLASRYQSEFGDTLPDDLMQLLKTLQRAPVR